MADTLCRRGEKFKEQLIAHNDKECDRRCPALKALSGILVGHWLANIETKDLIQLTDIIIMAREKDPNMEPAAVQEAMKIARESHKVA